MTFYRAEDLSAIGVTVAVCTGRPRIPVSLPNPTRDKIWSMLPEARVTQPVTEAEATQLAREVFGVEADARALPGEYDDNFHLTAGDGRGYVLKVMHAGREPSFVG